MDFLNMHVSSSGCWFLGIGNENHSISPIQWTVLSEREIYISGKSWRRIYFKLRLVQFLSFQLRKMRLRGRPCQILCVGHIWTEFSKNGLHKHLVCWRTMFLLFSICLIHWHKGYSLLKLLLCHICHSTCYKSYGCQL